MKDRVLWRRVTSHIELTSGETDVGRQQRDSPRLRWVVVDTGYFGHQSISEAECNWGRAVGAMGGGGGGGAGVGGGGEECGGGGGGPRGVGGWRGLTGKLHGCF